jgi:hypothetical protein
MTIDFDDVHRRFWRDHRGDPDAPIPVRGGDFVTVGGKRYAVLKDADGKLVAAYEVVERMFKAKDMALVEDAAKTAEKAHDGQGAWETPASPKPLPKRPPVGPRRWGTGRSSY